jgi:threonine dehydrogenase-like Zn-dependent dehydrogenase
MKALVYEDVRTVRPRTATPAYSALLQGAREVYCVDGIGVRLDKAGELGATPVDFRRGDPSSRSGSTGA